MTLEELTRVILNAKEKYAIEGVTYSGGEPTMQQNLPELTAAIQNMGLGVIAFTGRLYEDAADVLFGCDIGARRFISGWKSGTLPPSTWFNKPAYSVFNRPLPKSTDMV